MLKYIRHLDRDTGHEWIETELTGKALLNHSLLNKGTAFSKEERESLGLLGKLPFEVESLDQQVLRARYQYMRYPSVLQKHIYLNNLHDKNEILFYKLCDEDLESIFPMIYTPGVGSAVKEFSHEFRQPRGIYISYPDRDHMETILDNRTHPEVDLLVVTDGEGVLGIGDQGIGGMDIPIAKLIVYTLCGVDPYKTLPIMLDVGTNNQSLLNDPMYLGWRHPRIEGETYDTFIEQF
ncbi:MAG TPA: oxaloacetate-decarboxylating malate dehydrogenase, partial [Gammaproteobacteria bacterium]|nr:oxaloacetate-decarboxylating malate dehydrogenase [Gammaproteobacteria bacterium]